MTGTPIVAIGYPFFYKKTGRELVLILCRDNKLTNGQIGKWSNGQMVKLTNGQTYKLTNDQTYKLTNGQINN